VSDDWDVLKMGVMEVLHELFLWDTTLLLASPPPELIERLVLLLWTYANRTKYRVPSRLNFREDRIVLDTDVSRAFGLSFKILDFSEKIPNIGHVKNSSSK
jgi:hypothetical protein